MKKIALTKKQMQILRVTAVSVAIAATGYLVVTSISKTEFGREIKTKIAGRMLKSIIDCKQDDYVMVHASNSSIISESVLSEIKTAIDAIIDPILKEHQLSNIIDAIEADIAKK